MDVNPLLEGLLKRSLDPEKRKDSTSQRKAKQRLQTKKVEQRKRLDKTFREKQINKKVKSSVKAIQKELAAKEKRKKLEEQIIQGQSEAYNVTNEKGAGLTARRWLSAYKKDSDDEEEDLTIRGTGLTPGLAPVGYDSDSE